MENALNLDEISGDGSHKMAAEGAGVGWNVRQDMEMPRDNQMTLTPDRGESPSHQSTGGIPVGQPDSYTTIVNLGDQMLHRSFSCA